MNTPRSRLKVFQKITGDLKEELASRMLEIHQISDLQSLLHKLYSFGAVHMNDCSTILQGFIRVSFYDIRHATSLCSMLESAYSVKYVNCKSEHDHIEMSKEDYFELMPLLMNCGEISKVDREGGMFSVHFYDIRAARAALCLVNKHRELQSQALSPANWRLYGIVK